MQEEQTFIPMRELLENGSVVCQILEYRPRSGEQYNACTFYIKPPIDRNLLLSDQLELRSEWGDTAEIVINTKETRIEDGKMHIEAVLT